MCTSAVRVWRPAVLRAMFLRMSRAGRAWVLGAQASNARTTNAWVAVCWRRARVRAVKHSVCHQHSSYV
eukprot:12279397-Alexandrium_andersonii.AAC.1